MASNSIDPKIVVYPTDTVWGIGGAVNSEESILRINEIKKITDLKPQSVMFPSIDLMLSTLNKSDDVIFDQLFLKNLFSYQVTLAYPRKSLNFEIAPSVLCQSEYICVRVMEKSWIHQIYQELGGPFTTTSLNETGFPPITKRADANRFVEKNCPQVSFYPGEEGVLSGTSSTILKIENSEVSFWRKGEDVENLNRLFEQFSLNCN